MLTLNLSVDGVFDLFHRSASADWGLQIRAAYTLGHVKGGGCKSSHSLICISMPVTTETLLQNILKVEHRLEMM